VLGISLQQPLAFQIPGQTVRDGVSELASGVLVLKYMDHAAALPSAPDKHS